MCAKAIQILLDAIQCSGWYQVFTGIIEGVQL